MAGGVRLVLADDASDIRTLLRLMLGKAGYDIVAEADDGAEAVAAAVELQPDVVIIDLAMPVMDGLEAIPLIKEASPKSKIVVLSGFDSDRAAETALDLGAERYLQKGVALGDISQLLWDLCRNNNPS